MPPPFSILIIEDEAKWYAILQRYLIEEKCDHAQSIEDASDLLRNQHYDLVIADLVLSAINTDHFADFEKVISNTRYRIPIIIVTGYAEAIGKERIIQVFNDYPGLVLGWHTKFPFDVSRFQQNVQTVLRDFPRNLPWGRDEKQTSIQKATVVFLASDASDEVRLRLLDEYQIIEQEIQSSRNRDQFRLIPSLAVRADTITSALLNYSPQIVHFSGHGTKAGYLRFQSITGESHEVSPAVLSRLFKQVSSHVKCVILNACYSETQADLIAEHVETVIGMRDQIPDAAATSFSLGFYQALGAGQSYANAFEFGCIQMQMYSHDPEDIPILIQRK